VRCIFALYLKLGCVRQVKEEADRLGLKTKSRTTASGDERGGKPFSRRHIYSLLSNPIYIGQIALGWELLDKAIEIGESRAYSPAVAEFRLAGGGRRIRTLASVPLGDDGFDAARLRTLKTTRRN
jgi:hypothetical protein